MSREKHQSEAKRWLAQSKADLRAAKVSRDNACNEWACFQAQQAAEKAVKGLWYHVGADPWGHSLIKLIQAFPDEGLRVQLLTFLPIGAQLDKFYIPTRYPNGLPEVIPADAYTSAEASAAIAGAEAIINLAVEATG